MDKISLEVAGNEFDRWAGAWDIDTSVESMSDDDARSFEAAKRPLIRGLMDGSFTVNDEGNLDYRLKFTKRDEETTLSLNIDRADILEMDKYKDRQSMHKLNAYLASLVGMPAKYVSSLDPRDQKRLRGPVLLFLGS